VNFLLGLLKVSIKIYLYIFGACHLQSQTLHFEQRLLQAERKLLVIKNASVQQRPVPHIFESVDHQLTGLLNLDQFLRKLVFFLEIENPLKLSKLRRRLQMIASVHHFFQRTRDFVIKRVVYHVLKEVLALNLLVQNAKSDVFEEYHIMELVIDIHLLSDNMDQYILPL
jgi:nitrogenase molybdenum-iron protein alpha/beta subunit